MKRNLSKGQLEAEISKAVTKIQKEYLGRGPQDVRTYIVQDMILIRLHGVLTPAEHQLSKEDDGEALIKQMRIKLFESARPQLEKIIDELSGSNVKSMHSDFSTKTGERIVVFSLNENLEDKLKKQR